MLIVCPSCASEYAIDPAAIGSSGRRVRCAGCRDSWFVPSQARPDLDMVPAAIASPPRHDALARRATDGAGGKRPSPVLIIEPEPTRPHPAPARTRPGKRREARSKTVRPSAPGRPILAALAVLVCLAPPAAVAARGAVVRALPRTAIVFAAIGLPVNLVGVALADVTSSVGPEGEATVLVVEGRLANASGRTVRVPPLEVTIRGETGDLLYQWSVKPPRPELEPGDSATFRARLASPPPLGRAVRVTFAQGEAPAAVASR